MTEVVVYAFYVWVVVSLAVLVARLVRHLWVSRRRSTTATEAETGAAEPPTIDLRGGSPTTAPTTATPTAATAEQAPDASMREAAATDAAVSDAAPAQPSGPGRLTAPILTIPAVDRTAPSTDTAPSDTAPSDTAPAAPASPAPAPPATASPTPAPQPAQKTLADALRGVRLPLGLAPTVDTVEPNGDRRVALATAAGAPEDVGTTIADELERLGFTVAAHADDEAVATHPTRATVGLRIVPLAHAEEPERFPTAEDAAVVLQLWLID